MPILPLMLPGPSTSSLPPPPLIPARPIALPLSRSRRSPTAPLSLHPHAKQQQGDTALYSLVVPRCPPIYPPPAQPCFQAASCVRDRRLRPASVLGRAPGWHARCARACPMPKSVMRYMFTKLQHRCPRTPSVLYSSPLRWRAPPSPPQRHLDFARVCPGAKKQKTERRNCAVCSWS